MNRIGAYEVREELGRGAAGTVYRAYDPRLKREVAIKVLQPAASASSLQRFEREANTLARLRQRNAAGLHEYTVSEEQFDQFTSHFVPPSGDEGFEVVRYDA